MRRPEPVRLICMRLICASHLVCVCLNNSKFLQIATSCRHQCRLGGTWLRRTRLGVMRLGGTEQGLLGAWRLGSVNLYYLIHNCLITFTFFRHRWQHIIYLPFPLAASPRPSDRHCSWVGPYGLIPLPMGGPILNPSELGLA